jgi:hypothetical protein
MEIHLNWNAKNGNIKKKNGHIKEFGKLSSKHPLTMNIYELFENFVRFEEDVEI